ncbi:thioredoxin domain-containing protein, partial [bacterium]|nr:thioredoxin domain-containing protein [bacterium]
MKSHDAKEEKHLNRLAEAASPYLLQHADNPVDWYPWGEEALKRARVENKPIFLSIGYSACHWCHVMEHESFEDPETARILNAHFVCIKVDREERPDLDAIYMSAVQMLTGSGGWPLNVFLTPKLEPFYGGTYFPPVGRFGAPSFQSVLQEIAQLWEKDPGQVLKSARQLTEAVKSNAAFRVEGEADMTSASLQRAVRNLDQDFDEVWGGFGGAPKFPTPATLRLL